VRSEACRQLHLIHQDQSRLLNERVVRSVSSITEIRRGITNLNGKSTADLVAAVPRSLCCDLDFERAMISSIHGSMWIPRQLHFAQRGDPDDLEFERYVNSVQIPLVNAPLETEIVRNRAGSMVKDPEDDKRTFKQLVEVSRSSGYVAAPIISRGQAIGIIHADRPAGKGAVVPEDLETVSAFSECLSLLFESAILAERLRDSAISFQQEFSEITAALNDLSLDSYDPFRDASGLPSASVNTVAVSPHGSPQAAFLTAREREVLQHMGTGSTNAQIARALVISEETVKSHLKQISKKLGTSTRSAAVAKFAQLTRSSARPR
jgi:DNA-binding CsgD family transcriptional regulator